MRVMTDIKYNFELINIEKIINLDFGTRITKVDVNVEKYPVFGGGGESFKFDSYNRENSWVLSRFAMSENCVRFVSGKFYLLDSGATISLKKEWTNKVDLDYIGYFLLSKQKEIFKKYARGQGQKNLDAAAFKRQMLVPIYPNDIQKQIVSRLEKLEKLEEKRELNIWRCDELIKSIFYDIFGDPNTNEKRWKHKKLLFLLEKSGSFNELKLDQSKYQLQGKYPIVDQGEKFIAGYTDDSKKVYNGRLPVILFGDHTRILKFVDFKFALGADGVKIIRAIELDAKFLFYCLKLLNIRNQGYSRHYKILKDKEIILPDSILQRAFTMKISKIEKLKKTQIKSKEEIENLFNGLMQKYFKEG